MRRARKPRASSDQDMVVNGESLLEHRGQVHRVDRCRAARVEGMPQMASKSRVGLSPSLFGPLKPSGNTGLTLLRPPTAPRAGRYQTLRRSRAARRGATSSASTTSTLWRSARQGLGHGDQGLAQAGPARGG